MGCAAASKVRIDFSGHEHTKWTIQGLFMFGESYKTSCSGIDLVAKEATKFGNSRQSGLTYVDT